MVVTPNTAPIPLRLVGAMEVSPEARLTGETPVDPAVVVAARVGRRVALAPLAKEAQEEMDFKELFQLLAEVVAQALSVPQRRTAKVVTAVQEQAIQFLDLPFAMRGAVEAVHMLLAPGGPQRAAAALEAQQGLEPVLPRILAVVAVAPLG